MFTSPAKTTGPWLVLNSVLSWWHSYARDRGRPPVARDAVHTRTERHYNLSRRDAPSVVRLGRYYRYRLDAIPA